MVVVPTMLIDAHAVENLLEALEVRYLANQQNNVYFALLTDYVDAKTETTDTDAALLQMAREGIVDLNQKYHGQKKRQSDPFFLFHRPRLFNQSEGCWMGRERKRGKLGRSQSTPAGQGDEEKFAAIIGTRETLSSRSNM